MKYILFSMMVLLSPFNLANNISSNQSQPKKVLMVVSNKVDMGDPEKHDARNNILEVAPPFHVFLLHGYQVDFVSPSGGAVHFSGGEPMGISRYAIEHEGFLEQANASLKPSLVNVAQYSAVYIGGGAGPLFDVASDQTLLSLIAKIYEAGGVVGGCGHGPGGFANVKLSNGEFMVKGKRVAGFPDSTELSKPWAKQGTLLPFLVESQLNKNGAIALNKKTLKDKYEVVVDQRIVSTMFLPSSTLVAKKMITLLESGK